MHGNALIVAMALTAGMDDCCDGINFCNGIGCCDGIYCYDGIDINGYSVIEEAETRLRF